VKVVSGIGRRLGRLRPHKGTAFLTYIDIPAKLARAGEGEGVAVGEDAEYRFHEITSADDPELAFAPGWQRRLCRTHMATGEWYCLVAYETATGAKVGHVWATTASTRGLLNGVVDVRLAPDEVYVWDLFIDPAHRRLGLSQAMGWALIHTFAARQKRWGLTHVLYENAPSIMWHHVFGFAWMQVFNYIHIGDRIWWKIPFATCPSFGPLSRHGRHDSAQPGDPFGGALVPSSDQGITREQIRSLRRRAS
jgi:GNAT superfamily N-acetyltransferase